MNGISSTIRISFFKWVLLDKFFLNLVDISNLGKLNASYGSDTISHESKSLSSRFYTLTFYFKEECGVVLGL